MGVHGAGLLSAKHKHRGLCGPGVKAGLVRMLCLLAMVFFQAMDKEGRNLTYALGLSGWHCNLQVKKRPVFNLKQFVKPVSNLHKSVI